MSMATSDPQSGRPGERIIMGAGPGRQVPFRPVHTARNSTSPFPRKPPSPSDRPGAVQGAKRRRRTLDGEDRSGIIWREGKGGHSAVLRSVRFPSLPAGINTDDSDPLVAGIVAWNTVPLSGPVGTPLFWGVLSSSLIFLYRHYGSRIVGGKHRKTKEFKECEAGTPTRFFLEHPPFCPCTKK